MRLTIAIALLPSLVALALSGDAPDCPVCDSNIYVPDYNCSRFWQCANGIATLKECPSYTHFNPDENVCDWPWNFKHDEPCRGCNSQKIVCNAPKTTTKPTKLDPTKAPSCPEHCPFVLHVSDSTCCKYYWECDRGKAYRSKCPDGLVFNSETKVCDYDGCQEGRGYTWEDLACRDTSPQKSSTLASTTTTTTTTTKKPIVTSPNLPACDSGVQYFKNPKDCESYYQCSNGVAIWKPCPSGLHWNTEINVCDWPQNAGCILQ